MESEFQGKNSETLNAVAPTEKAPKEPPSPPPLVLTFAGDIMAHRCNYQMSDYAKIYEELRSFLWSDDLSFANLEMPIDDDLPLSTYPAFNVHSPYVTAAVQGGFDVFSLANNHSNDQGEPSILKTRATIDANPSISAHSGLRTAPGEPMIPAVIRKGEQTIVFLAVTEILNTWDYTKRLVYYVPPTPEARATFLETVREIRENHPEALFVLSIHLSEPEYVRKVDPKKRVWFSTLAEAGVDIVWGHHPHVMQEWEIGKTGERETLFMYSMGNFISGQRWDTDPSNPDGYREYTGDAVLLRVNASVQPQGFRFEVTPRPITVWRDPAAGLVVRWASNEFLNTLKSSERAYFAERQRLMAAYLPLLPRHD